MPVFGEDVKAHFIEKAVADLTGDRRPCHSSGQHAVEAFSISGSNDDKPIAFARVVPSSGVASRDVVVSSPVSGAVLSEARYGSNTRSILLNNQPSVEVSSTRSAESTSPPKIGSGGIKRSCSRKKLAVERGVEVITKLEKTGRPSKAVPSPDKIKIKISVSSTAASMAVASTGALSVPNFPIVKVER